jgi:4-carboxymuconolactone decarboxylase
MALRDDQLVAEILGDESKCPASGLDPKSQALARLAATIALDAGMSSYQHAVQRALDAGALPEEIVGTLLVIVSLTGVPKACSAAPKLALAMGYDVDAALERWDP